MYSIDPPPPPDESSIVVFLMRTKEMNLSLEELLHVL